MYGWLIARNLNIECLGEYFEMDGYSQYNNNLNKFPGDQVFFDKSSRIYFLDGYVYNKEEFMKGTENWQQAFSDAAEADLGQCLNSLRGGFCGYIYDKTNKTVTAYVDQVSVRALYYYVDGEKWIISNHFEHMVKVLQNNAIPYDFDLTAAKYMLTYGYMIDNRTFIRQIRRVMPGCFVKIGRGECEENRYYFINNTEVYVSEQEAVEKIDKAFRQAIKREFEKDREYGYRHVVDLSGGLDSRMVSWVSHDMGYVDQVNIAYCQNGYWDERISKKVAENLRHEYIFKSLDDVHWMKDIDKLTSENNGAALYNGISGGERMLQILNTEQFGIEHTGMIGDAILSTFYQDKEFNYSKPRLGKHRYSERLHYDFDTSTLREYPNQELFAIYSRGILGAQSSYMIRQQYLETASAFMDVDFLNAVFSLPFEYRRKHRIYLKWIKEKYPAAAEFGWEKWGGIKPKRNHIIFRKVKTTQRLLRIAFCKAFKINNRDIMTPNDYWHQNNKEIRNIFTEYYCSNITNSLLTEELRNDVSFLFEKGNVTEKSMALTVLAMAKKCCS